MTRGIYIVSTFSIICSWTAMLFYKWQVLNCLVSKINRCWIKEESQPMESSLAHLPFQAGRMHQVSDWFQDARNIYFIYTCISTESWPNLCNFLEETVLTGIRNQLGDNNMRYICVAHEIGAGKPVPRLHIQILLND